MSEGTRTIWDSLRWWWTWRIWRPARRRCSFCEERLTNGDLADGRYYGWGAWACASCTEYPER